MNMVIILISLIKQWAYTYYCANENNILHCILEMACIHLSMESYYKQLRSYQLGITFVINILHVNISINAFVDHLTDVSIC